MERNHHQLTLSANKVLLILSLEIMLALLLIRYPPINYATLFLSFLSIFIIPTISLTLLLVKNSINIVKLLFLSLVISPLLIGAITLLLSIIFPPLNRLLLISLTVLLTLTSLLCYVFKKKKIVIGYSNVDLVSLSMIFIASITIFHVITSLSHYPTPDENYYITNARLLLNYGQAFPINFSFWKESLTTLLSSRILWDSIIASFITTTGIPPVYSNGINLIFLLGTSTAGLLLIPRRYRNHPLAAAVPMLILLNPVLLMLSGFALNDLAIAFYNVASLVFFINSFKNISGKVELDLRNLTVAMLLQLSVLLIKFNLIFLIPYFLVLTINVFRFRLYRSKPGKAVMIFVILPALMYELILDIPRNLALYVFNTRALEFLSGFLPVSLIEPLILMFVSVPYSPTTVFSYTPLDYLWRFYVLFSPENLSIFIASIAIFLPLLLKQTSGDVKFKNMIVVTLLAILIQFLYAFSSGDWGDIPRYYASVIAPLTVVYIIFYLEWMSSKQYMMLLPLVGMLILTWSNRVLTNRYGGVAVLYAVGLYKTYNILIPQILSYVILVFALFSFTSIERLLKNKTSLTKLKVNKIILGILLLFAFASNIYFSSFAYTNSQSFRDYGLNYMAQKVEGGIVFSNSYALGTYAPSSLFSNGFISSMPSAKEFDSLIRNMPNGTKLIISDNPTVTGLSESFVGTYPKEAIKGELIVASNATLRPTIGNIYGAIFQASFLNGSYVTISGSRVEPKFNNISLVNSSIGIIPYFSGSGSFIEIPYSPVLNLTPPYTVETWVDYKVLGRGPAPTDSPILDSSTVHSGYLLFIRSNRVCFAYGFGNTACTARLTVNPDVWTYIVVSYNGTHTFFYVNGEKEIVEGPKFKPLNRNVPICIGCYNWAFSQVYYKGVIGVINIYNRLLSDKEVNSGYYSAVEPPYFKLSKKISLPNGNVFVYDLISPKLSEAKLNKDIVVKNLSWSVNNQGSSNPDIVLGLNIFSQKHSKVTVILSNDAFSTLQQFEVFPGTNIIDLKFKSFIPMNGLSPYGAVIARLSNILVIDGHGNIILNDFTSIFRFSSLQLMGYALMVITIALFLLFLMRLIGGIESQ